MRRGTLTGKIVKANARICYHIPKRRIMRRLVWRQRKCRTRNLRRMRDGGHYVRNIGEIVQTPVVRLIVYIVRMLQTRQSILFMSTNQKVPVQIPLSVPII